MSAGKTINIQGVSEGKHPCYAAGAEAKTLDDAKTAFVGTGDAHQCKLLVRKLLGAAPAEQGVVAVPQQMPAAATSRFYIFSYFFDRLVTGLGLPADQALTLGKIQGEAAAVCALTSEEVAEKYPASAKYGEQAQFCMDVIYEIEILETIYKLDKETKLTLAEKVKGAEASWCLGAILDLL